MADRLEFDVAINGDEAQALIRSLSEEMATAGKAFADALDFTGAVEQVKSLADALQVDQATAFADAMTQAAEAAAQIGPNVADLGGGGATGLADGMAAAADSAGVLVTDLGDVATSGVDAAAATADIASGLDDAASAATDTAASFGDLQGAVSEISPAQQAIVDGQQESNDKGREAVDLAGRLAEEFNRVAGNVGETLGPLGRFADEAVGAISGLSAGAAVGGAGIAAGFGTFLAAGEKWKNLSAQITQGTGATGEELDKLMGTFDRVLQSSGRAPEQLAAIMATLSRDVGVTGADLEKATSQTSAFLKATGGGAENVRGLTQAMKTLSVDAKGLGLFEDQLATATSHFGTNIGTLQSQLKFAGPALSNFGFNTGQIIGLTAQMDQAGLPVQRLVAGFTKLAQQANAQGISGQERFSELIANVKGANSATEALGFTQGIFAGRVATQFVNAVRNEAIDLEKVNAVMGDAPGASSRMAASMANLGTVFGKIRNDFFAAVGPGGLDLVENLAKAINQVRPLFHDLASVVAALGPVFKGLLETALAPLGLALKVIGPPIHFIAEALNLIPGPVREVIGGLIALRLAASLGLIESLGALGTKIVDLGATLILEGGAGVGSGLAGFASKLTGLKVAAGAAGGAEGAGGLAVGVGGATVSLGAMAAVAAPVIAGIAGIAAYSHYAGEQAKNFKDKVDAAKGALGEFSVTSIEGFHKLELQAEKGSVGKLFSDLDKKRIESYGLSINQVIGDVRDKALDPKLDIGKQLAQQFLDASGGIDAMVQKDIHLTQAQKDSVHALASTKDGVRDLTDQFLHSGEVAGLNITAYNNLRQRVQDVARAVQEGDKAWIDNTVKTNDNGAALVDLAVKTLGFTEVKGHETAVRREVQREMDLDVLKLHEVAAATDDVNKSNATFLTGLDKANASEKQLKETQTSRFDLMLALIDAQSKGNVTDQAAVDIGTKLGITDGQVVGKAKKELIDLEKLHQPELAKTGLAQQIFFDATSRGTPYIQALGLAMQGSGASFDDAKTAIDGAAGALDKFAEPVKASDVAMSAFVRAMAEGVPRSQAYAQALAATGGNAAQATAAMNEFGKGADDTAKSLDDLIPKLNTVADDLAKPAAGTAGGAKFWNDEKAAIEGNTAAQINNFNTLIGNAEAAKAAGVAQFGAAFDPTALNARIASLTTARDQAKGLGDAALADAQASEDKVISTAGDGIGKLIDTELAAISAKMVDTDTVAKLRTGGAATLMDIIFNPDSALNKEQKEKFLHEAAHASPAELQALEAKAKELAAKQKASTEQNKEVGDLFAKVDPSFVANSEKQGEANGTALAKGMAKSFIAAHIPEFINQLLKGGMSEAQIHKDFPWLFPEDKKPVTPITDPSQRDIAASADASTLGGPQPGGKDEAARKFGAVAGEDARNAFRNAFVSTPMTEADASFLGVNLPPGMQRVGVESGSQYSTGVKTEMANKPLTPEDVELLAGPGAPLMANKGSEGGSAYASSFKLTVANEPIAEIDTIPFYGSTVPAGSSAGSQSGQAMRDAVAGVLSTPVDVSTFFSGATPQADAFGNEAGLAFNQGMANGIRVNNAAYNAAMQLGLTAKAAVDAGLNSKSPSLEMYKRGQWFVEGLALGIKDHTPKAHEAATQMTDGLTAILGGTIGAPKINGGNATVTLGDGPGVDRIVRAIGAQTPRGTTRRRRLPFGGGGA